MRLDLPFVFVMCYLYAIVAPLWVMQWTIATLGTGMSFVVASESGHWWLVLGTTSVFYIVF